MPGEVKIATVESVESIDNMATLPVSQRQHGRNDPIGEQNVASRDGDGKKDKKQGKDLEMSKPKR